MNYTIAAIPIPLLDVVWPKCEPILKRATDLSHGETTTNIAYQKILNGHTLLLTVVDEGEIIACVTAEVRTFDSGLKALFLPLVAGDDMDGWIEQIYNISILLAKEHGCGEVRGICVRKGWSRKLKPLGWEDCHTVMRYKIGEH